MELWSPLGLASFGLLLLIIYKLVDYVVRWPTVGRYTERYVVITGCDSGFGRATAVRLDQLGCHVFAGCMTKAGALLLSKDCSDRLLSFELDITNHNSVLETFDFVKSRLPEGTGIWGLVNNAGIMGNIGPLEWLHLEDYKRVMDVNLFGLVDMTMTFLPLVKRSRGRVVNMSSICGRHSVAAITPYCVSKYGIEAFSDGLRRSLKEHGCKVSMLEPGLYSTNLSSRQTVGQSVERAWDNAPTVYREQFGQAYYKRFYQTVVDSYEKNASRSIDEVVDAYEHALFGSFPRARYVLGTDARFMRLLIQALPEWLGDWTIDRSDAITNSMMRGQ